MFLEGLVSESVKDTLFHIKELWKNSIEYG